MNLYLTPASITPQRHATKPWALPSRALTVFYGCSELPRLSHYFLPRMFLREERILYLDGANQISPLLIARFARERGKVPSAFNHLIRVSRAFTCFQLTELIQRVPDFLMKFSASVVIITALPDLYFDEDVRDREARASFERALEGLRRIAHEPISVAVFSDATSFQTRRRGFFQQLAGQADRLLKVGEQADGTLVFTCKKGLPQLPT